MPGKKQEKLPELFDRLTELGCLNERKIHHTADGFWAVVVPMSDILAHRGVSTVPGSQGNYLDCCLFFDDWYLYAVSDGKEDTYSLFKMREQEYDAELGVKADGDTPGVTIPFIALQTEILVDCLLEPSLQNKMRLNEEINRVVASGGQRHSAALKQYFVRTEAQGPYLIAKLYTEYIASLAQNGRVPVPERYAADCAKQTECGRVRRFVETNNQSAGRTVCDQEKICIADPCSPTEQERLAILATHTGNTSFFSFAAEVQFHAKFLTWWAKIPIPVIGRSPYASAIRADLSIGDAEMTGPTPYYRRDSRIVMNQYLCHKDRYQTMLKKERETK